MTLGGWFLMIGGMGGGIKPDIKLQVFTHFDTVLKNLFIFPTNHEVPQLSEIKLKKKTLT